MITNLRKLFLDIENRIGRKLTQAEKTVIRSEVIINAIPKGKRLEVVAKVIANRIIGEG